MPTAAAGALVLGLGGLPSANAASGGGAHKLPLTQTNRACDGSVLDSAQSSGFGFVNVVRPAGRKLVATVVLQGAQPNTMYDVRVIQLVPGDTDCHVVDGTLTTDAYGNGGTNVQEALLPGATGVWVDLNNHADFSQFYDTAPLSF